MNAYLRRTVSQLRPPRYGLSKGRPSHFFTNRVSLRTMGALIVGVLCIVAATPCEGADGEPDFRRQVRMIRDIAAIRVDQIMADRQAAWVLADVRPVQYDLRWVTPSERRSAGKDDPLLTSSKVLVAAGTLENAICMHGDVKQDSISYSWTLPHSQRFRGDAFEYAAFSEENTVLCRYRPATTDTAARFDPTFVLGRKQAMMLTEAVRIGQHPQVAPAAGNRAAATQASVPNPNTRLNAFVALAALRDRRDSDLGDLLDPKDTDPKDADSITQGALIFEAARLISCEDQRPFQDAVRRLVAKAEDRHQLYGIAIGLLAAENIKHTGTRSFVRSCVKIVEERYNRLPREQEALSRVAQVVEMLKNY